MMNGSSWLNLRVDQARGAAQFMDRRERRGIPAILDPDHGEQAAANNAHTASAQISMSARRGDYPAGLGELKRHDGI
jgi:hypothetical protein